MATVRFFVDEQGLLPEVCVKTGRSTAGLVTLRATYRPVWPILFLPLSMLASILGVVAGARHVSVTLPMSNEAVSRSRSSWRWSFALSAAGCCGLLLAASLGNTAVGIGMIALVLAGIATNIAARMLFWCGVSVDKESEVVTVSRCHQHFVDAMKELSHS